MKLKIENFALFEKETTFEIAPLTLLIGANSSGKSTFLKALDICHGLKFHSDNFDTDAVENYIGENSKIKVEINKNIYLALFLIDYSTKEFVGGSVYGRLMYLDQKSNVILTMQKVPSNRTFKMGDKTFSGTQDNLIYVEISRFIKIIRELHQNKGLDKEKYDKRKESGLLNSMHWIKGDEVSKQNSLRDTLELFGLLDDKNDFKEISAKCPSLISDYEIIDHDILFKEFIRSSCFCFENNTVNYEKNDPRISEIGNILGDMFKPIDFDRKIELVGSIQIIGWNVIGRAKRIYYEKDPLFKLLKSFVWDEHPAETILRDWFVHKWIKKFFSENISFEFNSFRNRRQEAIAIEYLLGSKDLVDWGTGAYRIVYYIYTLAGAIGSFAKKTLSYEDIETRPFTISLQELHVYSNHFRTYENLLSNDLLIIEEPEMNLHPDHQSLLAEMLFDFSLYYPGNIVIETHSEYMIRTFQYLRSEEESFTKEHCNIINFGFGENLGNVKNIKIENDGSLSDSFFSGFMNHSQDLELKLLAQNRKISSN